MYCAWATKNKITKWDPNYFLCYYPCKAAGSIKNFLMGKYKGNGENQGNANSTNQTEYSTGSARSINNSSLDRLDGSATTQQGRGTYGRYPSNSRQRLRNANQSVFEPGSARSLNDASLDSLDDDKNTSWGNTQRQNTQMQGGVGTGPQNSWTRTDR